MLSYEEAKETITPGIYSHFKGNKYKVLGIAKHSETLEPMVVYKALYGSGDVYCRPADMWNETIQRNGITVKRFIKVSD